MACQVLKFSSNAALVNGGEPCHLFWCKAYLIAKNGLRQPRCPSLTRVSDLLAQRGFVCSASCRAQSASEVPASQGEGGCQPVCRKMQSSGRDTRSSEIAAPHFSPLLPCLTCQQAVVSVLPLCLLRCSYEARAPSCGQRARVIFGRSHKHISHVRRRLEGLEPRKKDVVFSGTCIFFVGKTQLKLQLCKRHLIY